MSGNDLLRWHLARRLATATGALATALFRRVYAGYQPDAGMWRETTLGAGAIAVVLRERAQELSTGRAAAESLAE